MAQSANMSGNPTVRRRSQRLLMQVAVRVRGKDSQGKEFDEETETLAISAHGALILVDARVTSGSTIVMQHKRTQEEQECHVVFLGPVRGGKAEIGLEFSEPRPTFWRVAFPPEDWSSKHPDARPISVSRTERS
jgi:PilZ domain